MSLADTHAMTSDAVSQKPPAAASGARVRDLRLDFFRGIAMFIILFAHTPGNFFTLWIPARWGFSDATEIFVFCSGMASAIAFGATYDRVGFGLGTARVAYRVWQVYWAHVGLFLATMALVVFLTDLGVTERNYWADLNLWPLFVEDPQWVNENIWLSFMTLSYVPNYFDILPMYMVVLVMMPVVMALSRVNLWLVAAFIAGTWAMGQRALTEALGLPHFNFIAEPWVREDGTQREWFFNPFGWQLIFFTGFAFMRGWLPKPPVHPALILLALAVVIANVPFSNIGTRELGFDWARDWRIENRAWITKSDFGVLRYTHFLALAYLAWVAAGDKGMRLVAHGTGFLARVWQRMLAMILKVGQQSLAVFVVSMFLARLSGFVMDVIGRDTLTVVAVNLAGMGVLVITAYAAAWFRAQPWRPKKTA
jgi:hypothetical protein